LRAIARHASSVADEARHKTPFLRAHKKVLVNAVCPGWVQTDMGGLSASRDLEQGARGIVWAAALPDGGPHGGFFRDGKAIDW